MTTDQTPDKKKQLGGDGWMPIEVDEKGTDDDPYRLFAPSVHRAWMTKARELAEEWKRAGDGEGRRTYKTLLDLVHASVGDAYDEGFEDDNPHLREQADARWHERQDLTDDVLWPIVQASDVLLTERPLSVGVEDAFTRAAALRYVDLRDLSTRGRETTAEAAERADLAARLGLD